VVEQVAKEVEGKANVYEMDIDQAPNTSSELGVMSIPALLFFKGGRVEARMVGGVKKEKILEQLKKLES
jgi:thioredoxin 1